MPFADANTISIHTQIGDKAAGKAVRFVPQAAAELKSLISAATYDSLLASGDGTEGYSECEQAESLLALSFALPFINLRPTDRGGLSRIIGLDSQTSEEIMSAREMERYTGLMKQQAAALVAGLAPEVDADSTETSMNFGAFGISASTDFADTV